MEQLIKATVQKLQTPQIQFADVRITLSDNESIGFINGHLREYNNLSAAPAIGVRVLIDGCWGFAGSSKITAQNIDKLISQAISNARHARSFRRSPVQFPALPATVGSYHHQPEINPFTMDRQQKMACLEGLAKAIQPQGKIVHSYLSAEFMHQEKYYANTEGSYSHTSYYNSLPTMMVVAADAGVIQSRTWRTHECRKGRV